MEKKYRLEIITLNSMMIYDRFCIYICILVLELYPHVIGEIRIED